MKKILCSILCAVMLFGLLPFDVLADNSITPEVARGTWGGVDWTLDADGTLTIAPTKGNPQPDAKTTKWTWEVGEWREAVVYTSAGGASEIGGWPYDRTKVKKLVIEEGVTSIGSFTVNGYTNLTGEVIIPSTVTYIGQEAFQRSTMTKLKFAKGGTEELCIAQGAFKNLIIEEIALPDDRPVHIHAWSFLNSANLKHITFPATLTGITGTNHVDYAHDPNAQNAGNASSSDVFTASKNIGLKSITFGNEEIKKLFISNGYSLEKYDINIHSHNFIDGKCSCDSQVGIDVPADTVLADTKVEGLSDILENALWDNPSADNVQIFLSVSEEITEGKEDEKTAIEEMAGEQELYFVDLSLYKRLDNGTPVNIGSDNDTLLTIQIPFDSKKEIFAVYRYHDGTPEALPMDPAVGEEGFIIGDGFVTIYAKKFSTYAIGYKNPIPDIPLVFYLLPLYNNTITVEKSENGSVTTNRNFALFRSSVNITVTPNDGYELDSLIVKTIDGKSIAVNVKNGKYTFKMPLLCVTVKASFVQIDK